MGYETISLKEAAESRRSIYALNKNSPIKDSKIQEILNTAIKNVPSAFNSQSSRLVVLIKNEHDKFWDIVRDILKAHVAEDKWEPTGKRIQGFKDAYGTVLFFEDPTPIHNYQSKFPRYVEHFPDWSNHTSAMHQYLLWTAFEAEGMGCNLQHYNPLPDSKAKETWNLPMDWALKAQLVFGGLAEGAKEGLKERAEEPIGGRLFIHGADL